MNKIILLHQLEDYKNTYPNEIAKAQAFQSLIAESPKAFSRENLEAHITASCWLLSLDQSRVLLTHHKKLNMWLQLGGHCDGNQDTLLAAHREAVEESGITLVKPLLSSFFDLDIHEIPERKTEPKHLHYDMTYLFQVVESEEFQVSNESNDLQWVEIDRLEKYTTESSMLRMREKVLHFKKMPKSKPVEYQL